MSIESKILSIADSLSIDALGFVRLGRVSGAVEQVFTEWLAEGKHASMSYLEEHRALRLNPKELLEGAQSVIIVAVSYYPEKLQDFSAPRIAKYALGRDYHKVLRKLLQNLGDAINEEIQSHRFRVMVDTAPFFERYWAEQSGIGFIGRNSNLIIPGMGSFFFLGELLTTLELEPISQKHRGCGECRRCIDACPTKALSGHTLDARRCINYLTIEHRGAIDVEFSQHFGSRFYGCDTCQDVCPYNHAPLPSRLFHPSEKLLNLKREDLIDFSEDKYADLFFGTSCTRAKYEGMKRNAELYLENNRE